MTMSTSTESFKMASDIRAFLLSEIQKRKSKNPNLSLRVLAKKIGVSHSTLCQVLSGKRPLTERTLKRVLTGLGIDSEQQSDLFVTLHKNPCCFTEVAEDELEQTDAWYFDAILELTLVRGFQSNDTWIANQLGISVETCRRAIQTLIKTGALVRDFKGRLVCNSHLTQKTSSPDRARAVKRINKIQAEFALKEHEAILNCPIEERSSLGLTIAVDPADLPRIRRAAWDFVNQVHKILNRKNRDRKEVFRLQLGFFPLTAVAENKNARTKSERFS